MTSAAQLRRQIESALAERIPAALSFRAPALPELLPFGLPEVDAVLGGGLPLGAITELIGDLSSGRTTLALAALASVTRQGESCAYVDVSDALSPHSAAALGVDLRRLLWVRAAEIRTAEPGTQQRIACNPMWTHLDHALRATDLLLSTGGFRALVLDMGDVPPEQARRVPLATWYRFRLQAEKTRTLFLLMTRQPCAPQPCAPQPCAPQSCAHSCAAVSLHCRQGAIDWQQAAERSPRLLAGLAYRVSVERRRSVDFDFARKKPVASEALWSSTTVGFATGLTTELR